MKFENLGLAEPLLRAVRANGYEEATPIQAQAIPGVLGGRDLMGCAQTGTGKTAAFALPALHRLSALHEDKKNGGNGKRADGPRRVRCLILAPTRELAVQIGQSFSTYGKFSAMRHTIVYGGVGYRPQVRALQRGVDILVATPGRLLDLMKQGYVDLKSVEILILDEADQMLDMGFIHDLRRIVANVPSRRQTLMFSATMPGEIRRLASQWLTDPQHVQVTPVATPAQQVEQSVYFVETSRKPQLLEHFLQTTAFTRTLVFARTKHGADKIVRRLQRSGIRAAAIHGNKSQNARTRVLEQFKSNRPPVLVATDVAARGLDVQGISHVINYELPEIPEIYVHRIGRTGRAGAAGIATSFCSQSERGRLRSIERLTRRRIPIEPQAQNAESPAPPPPSEASVAVARPRRGNSGPKLQPGRRPKSNRRGKKRAVATGAAAGRGKTQQRRRSH